MTIILLLVAITAWFSGYQYGKKLNSNIENSTSDNKILSPPKWLYYLCGAPKSTLNPKGNLNFLAVRSQILGVSLAILAIIMEFWNPTRDIVLVGFLLSVLLPYIVAHYLYKRYEVK